MQSSKLKNIVLLILVITNLLLLLLLGAQRLAHYKGEDKVLEDAVALLADRGISVDPDILPRRDFPPSLSVERDTGQETALCTALLGTDTVHSQRGLVSFYTGEKGQAELQSDGAFTATLRPGAYPAGDDPGEHARSLLSQLGLETALLSAEGDTVTLHQLQDGAPVFSCVITLTYEEGSLRSLAGRRLPGQPTAADADRALSIPTLLTRFRSGVLESGDACSAILSATQGYLLSSGAHGGQLTPVLLVTTDANSYYVNALTGEVSRA